MRRALVIAVAAVAVALLGCQPDSVAFQATTLLAASNGTGQNLNDEIAIQFSQELDAGSVFLESLRVTDENGRRLSIRARSANDVLFIAPADPEGWPADSKLSVEVPHPWLGRPIRSATGAANGAPFRADIVTGRRFASRGGVLRLVYHSLPFSGGTDVTPEAEFLFELDGPLDADSLRDGILLEDLTQGEAPASVVATVTSPRRLSVAPFAGEHDFRPGTRYRLTLAASLRAQDTRRLAAPISFVFTTTRSHSGEHTTDFRSSQLVDPSCKTEKGPLTPHLAPLVPLQVGSVVMHERNEPFGREPSRVQILIPGEMLPDQNALITAMSFAVFGAESASLRLSARLDYAADAHAHDLGRSFEENWNLPASRPRDLIGAERDLSLLVPEDGILTLTFARPFFYDVPDPSRRRSLVLELVNESGILNDSAGIALRGENLDRSNPPRFLEAVGDSLGEGERQNFVPALRLSIQPGFRTVDLDSWTTSTVQNPDYFRRPDDVVATPGFVDFQVVYRWLDDVAEPRSGDWTPDLSVMNGHRTIQARIIFFLRSADPVPKDAGLLRLTVPFRERGE